MDVDENATRPAPGASPRLPVVGAPRAKPGYQRAIEVGLRSVHIASMGLVLGGIALGGTHETLLASIVATVVSGLLLLAASLRWGCLTLGQGAGWALLLKLALLGLGNVFTGARLAFYLAATLVSSVGSHMPSAWRHHTFSARAHRAAVRPGTRPA
jgi:hypothetical protein